MDNKYVQLAVHAEDITIGAVAAEQATAHPAGTTHLRLCATIACRVFDRAAGGTAAVGTDQLIPPNLVTYIPALPGNKLSAIQDAAAGKLNIMPVAMY